MTDNLSAKIYRLTVCPWTAENPRHDHQLIFPLNDGHLLLVWSEYYVRQPSLIFRTPYDKIGGAQDLGAAGNADGRVAALDRLRGDVDGAHGRSADLVDRGGGDGFRKPSGDHALPGDVLSQRVVS